VLQRDRRVLQRLGGPPAFEQQLGDLGAQSRVVGLRLDGREQAAEERVLHGGEPSEEA
jgi:hypothetical protein